MCLPCTLRRLLFAAASAATSASVGVNDFGFFHSFYFVWSVFYGMHVDCQNRCVCVSMWFSSFFSFIHSLTPYSCSSFDAKVTGAMKRRREIGHVRRRVCLCESPFVASMCVLTVCAAILSIMHIHIYLYIMYYIYLITFEPINMAAILFEPTM